MKELTELQKDILENILEREIKKTRELLKQAHDTELAAEEINALDTYLTEVNDIYNINAGIKHG